MITEDVILGQGVIVPHPELVNLYGCEIGEGSKIASFVEIQRGVKIGKNVKIEAFAFIPSGVIIEDGVFIGPHVCFTNDKYPKAIKENGELLNSSDWQIFNTLVKKGTNIGANSTIVCGVEIGEFSLIGAGSVITKSIPSKVLVYGNPAKVIRSL